MSVGGWLDFGQGAELAGFWLLLSASFVEKRLWSGGALGIWRNGSTFAANKSAINTITNVTTMRNRWAAQRR